MATSFRFSHLPAPSLNISGPTNPNDVKTIRTYTAISAIFGLGNILFPVFKTHNIPPIQDIPFILLPPLLSCTGWGGLCFRVGFFVGILGVGWSFRGTKAEVGSGG